MNIFELIVSDPIGYQQATNEYGQHNTNWDLFRQNMNVIFGTNTSISIHLSSGAKNFGRTLPESAHRSFQLWLSSISVLQELFRWAGEASQQ